MAPFTFQLAQEYQLRDLEEQINQQDEPGTLLPPDVRRKRYQTTPEGGGASYPSGVSGVGLRGRPPWGRAEYPPWYYPPIDAYILDLPLNRLPFAVPIGGSAALAIWPRVPMGLLGVVRKIGVIASPVAPDTLANLLITTRKNLAPVQPFPGVTGAIGTIEAPQDTQIVLAAGDVFDVFVQNSGANAMPVSVRTYGWWWGNEKV